MPPPRALIALLLVVHAGSAFADLWAYVDAQGQSHVANRQVDARYKLFFKGETTLDTPPASGEERPRAIAPARVQRFAPLIEANARATGLDAALVKAVVAVESAFDPSAVSGRGAIGLMQVLPETAERYGVTGDLRHTIADKLCDAATNVRVGTRYLRDLLARYDGDVSLALAAYNAGEGAVATHGNGVPPYSETRAYVKRVHAIYALYQPWPVSSGSSVTSRRTPTRVTPTSPANSRP